MSKKWTQEEIDSLVSKYKMYDTDAFLIVAEETGRSESAVRIKFNRIKNTVDLSLKWYEKLLKYLIKFLDIII